MRSGHIARHAEALLRGEKPKELPPTVHVATFEDWKHAVAIAHARLCQGSGVSVEDETWVQALARVAGTMLAEMGGGRPKGKSVPDEWVNFLKDVARRPSTSPDGCIALASGLRVPIASWPCGVEMVS